VLGALGFVDADEIRSIDGLPVAKPMSQMKLYAQLGDAKRFEVVFARNAVERRKMIEVVDHGKP
jgi:hypothetical protein